MSQHGPLSRVQLRAMMLAADAPHYTTRAATRRAIVSRGYATEGGVTGCVLTLTDLGRAYVHGVTDERRRRK